ncbi:MAG: PEP-CTERM sorting domain-containing protein [Candidatus Hodarchaeota archaeon]
MESKKILVASIVIFFLYPMSLFAGVITPDIDGFSTATKIVEGEYESWYYYEIEFNWNLAKDISHWDLILKPDCAENDHLIEFAGGISNGGSIIWFGYFERKGDKSMDPEITDPVVKFEPQGDPGTSGTGTFWFYSNIIPEYLGPYDDIVAAKAGPDNIYGPLEGAYPSCTIPEPATVILFGVGSIVLVNKKF